MTIYKKLTLFAIGALGVSTVFAGSLIASLRAGDENVDEYSAMGMHEFHNSNAGRRIQKTMDIIKSKENCEKNGGSWNQTTGKCSIPQTANKPMHAGYPILPKTTEDDCMNSGGYWWEGNGKCYKVNLTAKPKFNKRLKEWESVDKTTITTNKDSIAHLKNNDLIEVKKNDKDYVVIFKKGPNVDKNWDFPRHYVYGENKKLTIWEIWGAIAGLIKQDERKTSEIFLYNESKNTWWNCRWGGNVIFLK